MLSEEIKKIEDEIRIIMYLDSTSSMISSLKVSCFFIVFLLPGCGISGSKEINDSGISLEDSVVGAGNNIGGSSSSKVFTMDASIKRHLGRN